MKKGLVFLLITLVTFLSVSCKKTVTIGTKTIDVSKNYTIFISQSIAKDSLDQMRKGFVKGMVEKGFVENQNVTYMYENANGDSGLAEKIADLAIEKAPNLIISIGEISTVPLSNKIKDIPIIFMGCANAEKMGLCDDKSMPVSNVTGVRDSHLLDESLKYISENHEDVKKLGYIYNVNNELSNYDMSYLKFYATGYDIDIYTVGIKKAADIGKAIDNILPKVDGVFFSTDDMVNESSSVIIDAFTSAGKKSFAVKGEIVNDKLIYTISPDKSLVGYEAADIADTLLKGKSKVKDIQVRDVKFS